MSNAPEALGLRFLVNVDDIGDLGDWQKCEGLSIEYDISIDHGMRITELLSDD